MILRPSRLCVALLVIGIVGGVNAHAALKGEPKLNTTHAVRQGTQQLALHSWAPCDLPMTRAQCDARAWAACEADAQVRTVKPGAVRRTFTMKTGSGYPIGTAPTLAECKSAVLNRLLAEALTRETGGNVNTCAAVTSYSTAAGSPSCLSTSTYIVSYTANVSCQPAPGPRPRECPAGQLGAWAQTASVGPLPTCTVTWAPDQPSPGDCFTLDSSATLSWTPPTKNTNGSTLTDLAGFRVLYGRSATELVHTIQIPSAGVTRYVITTLDPATWFFAVRAYSTAAGESVESNIATKTIR